MASNTLSINKIIRMFQDISERHMMINSFSYGPLSDINTEGELKMPYLHIENTNSILSKGTGIEYREVFYDFDIYVMDRINKGDSNYQDTTSDTLYILHTIITEISQHPYYVAAGLKLVNDIESESVFEATDENVNGHRTTLRFKQGFRYTPCTVPIDEIPGWTFSLNGSISTSPVSGAAGPQGPQGGQGPQGLQGVTGSQGPQGATGSQGNTGVQGATGPQGFQGATGPQGNTGVQGATGPQGFQGFQGATGSSNVYETTTDGAVTSATTSNVYTSGVLVPANSFTAGNNVELTVRARKTGTAGNMTVRIYANTTNNISGSPILIATNTTAAVNQTYLQFQRFLSIKSATASTEVFSNTGGSNIDWLGSNLGVNTLLTNWTADLYIVVSTQCTVSGDSANARSSFIKIKR